MYLSGHSSVDVMLVTCARGWILCVIWLRLFTRKAIIISPLNPVCAHPVVLSGFPFPDRWTIFGLNKRMHLFLSWEKKVEETDKMCVCHPWNSAVGNIVTWKTIKYLRLFEAVSVTRSSICSSNITKLLQYYVDVLRTSQLDSMTSRIYQTLN